MNELYRNAEIDRYISALSSREAVPGGGSAAALTAATAAALNIMVINFSYKSDSLKELIDSLDLLKKSQIRIRERIVDIIDEDCRVFKELMSAISAKENVQEAFKIAAIVPLELCRLCHETINITEKALEICNKNLISDLGCASNLIKAGFDAAVLNVRVNMKYLENKSLVKDLDDEMISIAEELNNSYYKITNKVNDIVRG